MAQLPREVVGSLSLEAFQNPGDVALRDVGSGHSGVGWGWTWGSERSFPTFIILLLFCASSTGCPERWLCSMPADTQGWAGRGCEH